MQAWLLSRATPEGQIRSGSTAALAFALGFLSTAFAFTALAFAFGFLTTAFTFAALAFAFGFLTAAFAFTATALTVAAGDLHVTARQFTGTKRVGLSQGYRGKSKAGSKGSTDRNG